MERAGFGPNMCVDAWFQKAAVNKTGEVRYTKFIAALLETQGELQPDKVLEAFHSLDMDRSGYITRNNLKDALGMSNRDSDYLDRLVEQADTDGDGKISFEDFQAAIHRERFQNKQCHPFLKRAGTSDITIVVEEKKDDE